MAWLKGFTYDGIESLDYDLYITSGSVYDAPERVVDMIKVPGRNGNLAIDRGKFENIDVEYNVYTKDRSQTSFAQNIRDFRNELCSRHEYLRLTDDYNSDEFRLGIYKSGLEFDADIDRAGAIKLTFDCKPQRFLTAGETERSIPEWSDLHTDSGSLVTVDNSSGEYAVKSLSTDIVPQQSGSGDPSPTNIRPITGFSSANIYVSPTTSVGDATTYNVSFGSAGTVYGGTLDVVSGQLTVTHGIKLVNELSWTYADTPSRCSAHITDIKRASGARRTTLLSSEYVCVDDGRPLADVPNGSIYNAGTSDWVTIVDARYTTADAFTTAQGSQQIVYPLATPLTYQLTATQVAFLLGTNNIWSDTGDIQIEYGKGGNTLFNPTLFDSKPLLVVTGYGNLGINSQTLTIENGYPSQVVYIDCDSMEAWTESGGVKSPANDLIQNAGDAFPVLESGVNVFSLPVTITSLKVTPRWWRI